MNTLAVLFLSVSFQFNLPTDLLSSVCYMESHHNVNAIHHNDGGTDSYGVCQIKLETAQWLGFQGSAKELMLPSTNIVYAAKYLSYQLKRHDNNVTLAVISYNQGSTKGLTRTNYSDTVLSIWRQASYEYQERRF